MPLLKRRNYTARRKAWEIVFGLLDEAQKSQSFGPRIKERFPKISDESANAVLVEIQRIGADIAGKF